MNGKLFDMPAGELQMAAGAEYRDQEGEFETDVLTRAAAALVPDLSARQRNLHWRFRPPNTT